jgi:hypothetical protein
MEEFSSSRGLLVELFKSIVLKYVLDLYNNKDSLGN